MTETTAAGPIETRDGCAVFGQLYIQDGRVLYKVSTVYETYITAQVCMENGRIPDRTRVRQLPRRSVIQMTMASDRIVKQYHNKLDGLA